MMTNYNRQREKKKIQGKLGRLLEAFLLFTSTRHTPRFCALYFKVSTLVTAAPTSLVYLKLVSPDKTRCYTSTNS